METRKHFTRAIVGAGVALVVLSVMPPVVAQKPIAKPTPKSPPPVVINNILPTPAPPPTPNPNAEPKLDKPWWTYILPPVITLLGQGAIAWFAWKQFQKNYEQKNREITDRDAQVKLAEDNKAEQFKVAEANKAAQFRSKELQDQFGDIQNRLASPEPIIRANAALRLAQFGETLKPGVAEGEPRTEKNNPYFVPVVSQLATALYLEPNPAIRKAIREAFKNLIAFVNTDCDDQPLLHALIERLADANRTARDNFVKAFAEWTVVSDDWIECESEDAQTGFYPNGESVVEVLTEKIYKFLFSVAPFCDNEPTTRLVFKSLMAHGVYRNLRGQELRDSLFTIYRMKFEQRRKSQKDELEREKEESLILNALDITAQQLIDTRDALVEALKYLKQPSDFPINELTML